MTTTLNQLAIALGMDVSSTKTLLTEYAQKANNTDLAKSIPSWKANTELPDEIIEYAKNCGLDVTRKSKPKVNGQLANSPDIIAAFKKQLPQMLAGILQNEQQLFVQQAKLSGQMTGIAASLQFQQELITAFAAGNDAFRGAREQGLIANEEYLNRTFTELYGQVCDQDRLYTAQLETNQTKLDDFQLKMNALQNALQTPLPETTPDNMGK